MAMASVNALPHGRAGLTGLCSGATTSGVALALGQLRLTKGQQQCNGISLRLYIHPASA